LSVNESISGEKVNVLKDSLKKRLQGTPLYSPARDAYQLLFNRNYWKHRRQMTEFYSQFCSKGDMVFDVGANVGWYTEMFLGIGAKVVAVEPSPDCAAKVRQLRPRGRLIVENVAVGNAETVAPFFLCDDSDTHSTLSTEWIGVAGEVPRLAGKSWSRVLNVPVTTLDHLVAKHGEPTFMKIDVEGFEREVLSGLSRMPRYLSFEFISEFLDAAVECVRKGCFSTRDSFNILVNDPSTKTLGPAGFELQDWVTAEQIISVLGNSKLRQSKTYGEVFVRRGR
jgi:FkbM family methyltransferase